MAGDSQVGTRKGEMRKKEEMVFLEVLSLAC